MFYKLQRALEIVQENVRQERPVYWSKLGLPQNYATAFKFVLTNKTAELPKMLIQDGRNKYVRSSYYIPKKGLDVKIHRAVKAYIRKRTKEYWRNRTHREDSYNEIKLVVDPAKQLN